MSIEELIDTLRQHVDTFSENQMDELKTFLIQTHADRNKAEHQVAAQNIIQGLEQIFSQLDKETVQLLKDKIQA